MQPCNGGRRRQKAPARWTTRTAMVVVVVVVSVVMMMMEVSEAQAQAGAECVLRPPPPKTTQSYIRPYAGTWGKRHGHRLADSD